MLKVCVRLFRRPVAEQKLVGTFLASERCFVFFCLFEFW